MATRLPLVLSDVDRDFLKNLLGHGQLNVKVYKRATALLEIERGRGPGEVSTSLEVSRSAVSKWVKRYRAEGLQMLHDRARAGRPVEIDGVQRAKVTALACSTPPTGHGQWSLRLLADKAVELGYCEHICHTQVAQILKKTNSSRT